jgi:hypothetical protein
MATATSTRRDERFNLRPGCSFVEFREPLRAGGPTAAALTRVSVAGLSFDLPAGEKPLPEGTRLRGVALRIGDCLIEGDVVIRSSAHLGGRVETGCLFYPDTECEDRWMTLLAGVAAAAEGRSG